jgi:hypothetical protein
MCQWVEEPVRSSRPAAPPARFEPYPLGEHYLVVIAADAPLQADALRAELGELDIAQVSGEAAARAVPGYLAGMRAARWTGWVVRIAPAP